MDVRAPRDAAEALEYLYRDPFRNAALIGAIERGTWISGGVEIWVAEEGSIRGVLVSTPGPEGTRSSGLDADDKEGADALLRTLRPGQRLQFSLHRPAAVTALTEYCETIPAGVMLAFRYDGPYLGEVDPDPARELTRADERVVRRSRDELFLMSFEQAYRGRVSPDGSEVHAFGVIEGQRLLARCLTTWASEGIERQIGTVWSVFTEPSARGRGLGRAAVAAGTAAILASGRIARYFAFSDNAPSIRICHSLGYKEDHAVRYFWAQRRK